MQRMHRSVKEHNIYWWAAGLIGELCDIRLDEKDHALPGNKARGKR
jgi:hypothetical protein